MYRIRVKGNHKLQSRPYCNWNKELLKEMEEYLSPRFDVVTSEVAMLQNIYTEVVELFDSLQKDVQGMFSITATSSR